jgi:hypothetical protein
VYTFFAPYSSSYPLSPPSPCSHGTNPPTHTHRACLDLLFSDFLEEKKIKRKTSSCLFEIKNFLYFTPQSNQQFPYDVFMHIYILQPQLVHLLYSSSFHPSPLSMVAPAIHSCTESTSTTFKFLVSFPCPISPVHDLSLVWPVSHNTAAFVLDL